MSEPPQRGHIRRNFVHALLGLGCYNACRLLVVWILANWCAADVVGAFQFASTTLAPPIVLFLALELRAAFVADTAGAFPFPAYQATRRLGMLAATLVLTAAVAALYLTQPGGVTLWAFVLLLCLGRIAYHLGEVEWGWFQRCERVDLMGASNALRGLAMLACFACLPLLVRSPLAAETPAAGWLPALAGASLLLSLLVWWRFDLPAVRRLAAPTGPVTGRQIAGVARRAFPLGLVMLLIHLGDAIPGWIVYQHGGFHPLAYVGVLKYLTMAASFVVIQLGTAAGNELASRYRFRPAEFPRLAIRMCAVAAGLGGALLLATWLLGGPILRIFFDAGYAAHEGELTILMAGQAVLLLGSMFGVVTTHIGRFWVQVPIQLAVVAVATGVAAWLVPADPVRGFAWAAVARAGVLTLLYGGCVLAGLRAARARGAAQE